MRMSRLSALIVPLVLVLAPAAYADCNGGLGRGWASGKGNGQFEMRMGESSCVIDYPAFIDDANGTRTFATELALTRAPANGKIGVSPQGIVYMPSAGFAGQDKFCIRNTTPEVRGKTLSGCVTVTVR
ncbi:hypothetical protein PARHAE_00540 [Paracoccus haematequi]|uniref:Uncharacterized protein n=2 Tax=Paracoccus haematequi TaxID=2491866 RepID=A0A3S4CGJ0_9RHOB|nr:hypothetical protein PARHAE_00540 [Paracoccus haematequi]